MELKFKGTPVGDYRYRKLMGMLNDKIHCLVQESQTLEASKDMFLMTSINASIRTVQKICRLVDNIYAGEARE